MHDSQASQEVFEIESIDMNTRKTRTHGQVYIFGDGFSRIVTAAIEMSI